MDQEKLALAKRKFLKYINGDKDQAFTNALFDLIKLATSVERHKLKDVYPEFVFVFLTYGWEFGGDRESAEILLREIHIND